MVNILMSFHCKANLDLSTVCKHHGYYALVEQKAQNGLG